MRLRVVVGREDEEDEGEERREDEDDGPCRDGVRSSDCLGI